MADTASTACETEFAGDRDAMADEVTARLEGLVPVNMSNMDINDEAVNTYEELDPSKVRARATRLLFEGDGALAQSSEGPLVPFATPLLLKFASEAVNELLEQQRDAVVRSCGGQVTKDLALGTLLADALGIDILPEEACRVGKAAATQLRAAKDADKSLMGNAASKRTQARKSANTNAERAAGLDTRLATIDAERDAARATHWGKRISLPLPEGRLVQPRARPPPPAPKPAPPKPAVDALTAARAALAAAQAAHTQAELDARKATRALAKLQPPNFSGKKVDLLSMSDELFQAISAAEMTVSETKGALQLAALHVKHAEGTVELEINLAEAEKKAEAERAARQREREAAEAERAAAVVAKADAAVASANRREMVKSSIDAWRAGRRWYRLSRLINASAALEEIEAAEARDETRARLESDAAKVWGTRDSAGKENSPPPKVISFVGKSAESVRAEASSRGVRVGVEHHVSGKQCLVKCAGEYTVYSGMVIPEDMVTDM